MDDKRMDNDKRSEENNILKPDSETLHKTDPQENMEGPVSSTMHKTGEAFDSDENKEQADERREKNM